MRHADDDLLEPEQSGALYQLLVRGHQGLAAVEPQSLGAGIFHVEAALKDLSLDQLPEDRLLAFRGEADGTVGKLDVLLDPGPLLGIGDMHVFGADMLTIAALQDVEDLAQRAELKSK